MIKDNTDRREFLKKAGKAAVTAPAVAVLMSANAKAQVAAQDDILSGAVRVIDDDIFQSTK